MRQSHGDKKRQSPLQKTHARRERVVPSNSSAARPRHLCCDVVCNVGVHAVTVPLRVGDADGDLPGFSLPKKTKDPCDNTTAPTSAPCDAFRYCHCDHVHQRQKHMLAQNCSVGMHRPSPATPQLTAAATTLHTVMRVGSSNRLIDAHDHAPRPGAAASAVDCCRRV